MATYLVITEDGHVEAEQDGETLWTAEIDEVALRQIVNKPTLGESFAVYVRRYFDSLLDDD